jgi:hypothetical protein
MSKYFKAGYIYPLLDPERYDDEDFGTGFGHVLIPAGSDPGTCFIVDAWIVNERGEQHPGMDACPVPVHLEDVDLTKGRRHDEPDFKVRRGGWLR